MSRAVIDGWLDAFRTKDISKLELTEDFVHTSPFGEIKGRQAYLDLTMANPDAFFSSTITTLDVLDCGDKFAIRYLVDDMPACDCIYVRDGQIAEIHSYYHYGEPPSF
ncbi:MAG: nuclear transport factor 2 family protein [Chloroflexota bacterium]